MSSEDSELHSAKSFLKLVEFKVIENQVEIGQSSITIKLCFNSTTN